MNAEGDRKPATPGTAGEVAETIAGWMQAIAPYGIFTTDAELRIRGWNQWMISHSGLAESQVVGRTLGEIFPDLAERPADGFLHVVAVVGRAAADRREPRRERPVR